MAACESIQHIFDNPLPESPSLSASPWNEITAMKAIDEFSFTELFADLHFPENNHVESSNSSSLSSPSLPSPSPSLPSSLPSSSSSSSSSSFSCPDANDIKNIDNSSFDNNERNKNARGECYYPTSHKRQYRHSDSFSSMNSESLSLCTEGLGFESSDEVEELRSDISLDWQQQSEEKRSMITRHKQQQPEENTSSSYRQYKRSRVPKRRSFPPPISCIGMNGKPWVYFKSYRQDGRFILKEIRMPTQEFLHACREDGRLKLHLVQSDDEFVDGDDDDDDDDDEDEEDEADEGKGEDFDDEESRG